MNEDIDRSLHERVTALENTIRDFQRSLEYITARVNQIQPDTRAHEPRPHIAPGTSVQKPVDRVRPASPPVAPGPQKPQLPAQKPFALPDHMQKTEFWLNRIGIGLLLFAVVFLFKYSIDKGWLTPTIRIIFGLVLGTALLTIGARVYARKKQFSQLLSGGAIATYYITGFAAFQVFSLVSHPVAFSFMIAVTILAFLLALRQDEAVFSLVATIGGLGTPFMLYTDSGSIPGLMLYTAFILAGTGAIYFYRGWCSLLWLSIIGGWAVFLVALANANLFHSQAALSDQGAIQSAVLFSCLMFWAVPVVREVASSINAARWRPSRIGFGDSVVLGDIKNSPNHHVFVLTSLVPLISLGISKLIWPALSHETWGWITMAGAAVYGFAFWILDRREKFKHLALVHGIMGLLFFSVALSLLLKGDTLLVALAAEAAVLHVLGGRAARKGITVCAHILFAIIGLWLAERLYVTDIVRLMKAPEGTPIINARALSDLWVIVLGLGMSALLKSLKEKRTYLIVAATAFAAWLCRELEGNILFLAFAAETVIMHVAASKKDRIIAGCAHVFWGGLGLWLAVRLFNPHTDQTPILNAHALINLLIIATAVAIYKLLRTAREKNTYLVFAHIALLGWFLSKFINLENGQGYVTIAWGVYSAALLVIGLVKDYHKLRTVSMITLFVVVGKLFLVDLANLEVLWRILLFMGFGGLFLFLSYYFQDLWKAKPKSGSETD